MLHSDSLCLSHRLEKSYTETGTRDCGKKLLYGQGSMQLQKKTLNTGRTSRSHCACSTNVF